jgi:GNAT superfamily N-acetyltransferase
MKSGVTIRPWQEGDFGLLAASAPRLSERTLRLRFWGAVPTLPAAYLRSTEQRWPRWWDAVAALDGTDRTDGAGGTGLVGWAEYGRNPDAPQTADVAVCVVDDEQGHGLGIELLAALIERARGAGLVSVHADIAAHNEPARRGWVRVTGSEARTMPLAC